MAEAAGEQARFAQARADRQPPAASRQHGPRARTNPAMAPWTAASVSSMQSSESSAFAGTERIRYEGSIYLRHAVRPTAPHRPDLLYGVCCGSVGVRRGRIRCGRTICLRGAPVTHSYPLECAGVP